MNLHYVFSSMLRRKLRTFIITLALTIGVALVGALLALIDTQQQFSLQTIGAETGGYDIAISKRDLAESPFFDIAEVSSAITAANAGIETTIATTYARIQVGAEGRKAGALQGEAVTVVALDGEHDSLVSVTQSSTATGGVGIAGIRIGNTGGSARGRPPSGGGPPNEGPPEQGSTGATSGNTTSANSTNSTTSEGIYPPAAGQVFLDSTTASALNVKVGDEISLVYAIPIPRTTGKAAITGTSRTRVTAQFMVAGIGTLNGLSSDVSKAIVMQLSDAQTWLGHPDQANQLLAIWNTNSTTNVRNTVSAARQTGKVVEAELQTQLGDDFVINLPKYSLLESSAQTFAFTQTYITLYGILSMSIVGLMVNALMTTTVAEQKYDFAVLRVIGASRTLLYSIVIFEVVILGSISIVLGLLLGRVINDDLIVPIMLTNLSLPAGTHAAWTLGAVLIPTSITAGVLVLATISPARTAAHTKVMLVLNPAAADQPTLEDLAHLRERRPNIGLLLVSLVLLAFSSVILIVLPTIFRGGNITGQALLNSGSLFLMVVGIGLLFYFFTTPIERLLVTFDRLIVPTAGFFIGSYVLRGRGRSALISLMVVMSSVLPMLLATQLALQDANAEVDSQFSNGAPLVAQRQSTSTSGGFQIFRRTVRTDVTLSAEDIEAVTGQPGIGTVVAVADNLPSMKVSDEIGLRTAQVSLIGVAADLSQVLYAALYRWKEGSIASLGRLATEPGIAVISEGLSTSLDLHQGDTLIVTGNGTDHTQSLKIVAVAARIPGFSSYFTRNSSDANSSGILINLNTYRKLQHDPADGAIDQSADIVTKLMATTQTGVDQAALLRALRSYLSDSDMTLTATSDQVTQARAQLQQSRVFIVLLTGLSMVTAVFGVLAVMYTTVTSRRNEIGMLKAIGSSKHYLREIFIGEAMITTLSAGIAGIVAGTILGYVFVISQRFQNDQKMLVAFDFGTAGLILALLGLAAIFSGALATQPIIRQKAIVILRER